LSYDVVVVGAGLAGLSAALRAAQAGLRVAVVATGVGSLHLGGATIDVLGYAPERVASPARKLPGFTAARPDHPYARTPPALVREALEWLTAAVPELSLTGSAARNILLPTAVGALKPSALVPASLGAGDLRSGGRVLLAGFRALKDFYPLYAAANLNASGVDGIEARAAEVTVTLNGDADPGPVRLARRLEEPAFRARVAAQLRPQIEPGERVGVPAILGLDHAPQVWSELQERIEAPLFEIPTLPPSLPGMRLYGALNSALRRAGGRIVIGGRAVEAALASGAHGRVISGIATDVGGRPAVYSARQFVLATGGIGAGGISMTSDWRLEEAVLGLPLAGVPGPDEDRFGPNYFDSHRLSRVGIAVDDSWRPVDEHGDLLFSNLRAAGASLAGAEPWKEKSGNGISLVTGYAAAGAILLSAG
jgi:glycerol-3-phosphate dehydrogenase subunit B